MHLDAFARELPLLFEDFPRSRHPCDRCFRAVLEAVPGLAAENNLALLNLAVSLLEPGESYVEVGTWKGRSLIAAALGNDADLVGIDDSSHPAPRANRGAEPKPRSLHRVTSA